MTAVKLGVVAMFRNEARYLEEWINFHEAQGFSHFYLFDDQSSDAPEKVLRPFISRGLVVLNPAPVAAAFKARQLGSYNLGLDLARNECEWLAVIDVDEFLFSPVGDFRKQLPTQKWIAGVFVWWKIYGSSGHSIPPREGVLSSYTWSATLPKNLRETSYIVRKENNFFGARGRPIAGRVVQGKSILRTQSVRSIDNCHKPVHINGFMVNEHGIPIFPRKKMSVAGAVAWLANAWHRGKGMLDVRVPSCERLRINHYWAKSEAELLEKSLKQEHRTKATVEDYRNWNRELNQEQDFTIQYN